MRKICVYAISKNEEKFVNRWYDSVKEADDIYVLDTGSTDNTVEMLKKLGVNVSIKEITPWRFDVARNESLKMVPSDADACVCIDLDEVLNPGWRNELENSWKDDTTRLRYIYNWKLDSNNKPLISFLYEKIHSRNDYKWTHPVHEVLEYIGKDKENFVLNENIVLNHYPDPNKSRSEYLPLLELSVKEDPSDDRNMHYLGREYMYYGKWNEAIDTLKKHLKLEKATWKDERCASMRFIGRCYEELNEIEKAREWLNKAIIEAPYLRDPYAELLVLEYSNGNYKGAISLGEKALKINKNKKSYINEQFSNDDVIYDLLSICYYYEKDLNNSLYYINKALEIRPNDDRLKENKKIVEEEIKFSN